MSEWGYWGKWTYAKGGGGGDRLGAYEAGGGRGCYKIEEIMCA